MAINIRKIKKIITTIILVSCFNWVNGQLITYQFELIDSLQKVEKRNIAIFIHTDWCKYCLTMQNTTLKDDNIIYQLNNHYYFIELNAELRKDIVFNGNKFAYKPTGINIGIHELAEQLASMNKEIAYPTLCFLNTKYEIIFQYNQFINSKDLAKILIQLK